jgi:hypothetical protein
LPPARASDASDASRASANKPDVTAANPGRAERVRVAPPEGEHDHESDHEERRGAEHGKAGMSGPCGRSAGTSRLLEQDRKADAARDDGDGDRHADPPVADEADEDLPHVGETEASALGLSEQTGADAEPVVSARVIGATVLL